MHPPTIPFSMPSIAASFDTFFAAINLSGDHRAIANARKERIVALLEKDFHIIDSFTTGSIPKFTALASEADLDVFVVLHFGKHIKDRTPLSVLTSIQDTLRGNVNRVRKNGQAVTLDYVTWPNVDIVPVSFTSADGTLTTPIQYYSVPNAHTGRWIPSNPKTHAAAIETRSATGGPNFRRIIKMIKYWNERHSAYLSSFHIEVLALRICTATLQDLPWDLYQFFDRAIDLLGTSLYYEFGFVDDYLSPNDRSEVIRRIERARDTARNAWLAGYEQRVHDALSLWRQLFGEHFPSHG